MPHSRVRLIEVCIALLLAASCGSVAETTLTVQPRECRAADLAARWEGWRVPLDWPTGEIRLANRGSDPCRISGGIAAELLSPEGQVLVASASEAPAPQVVMASGTGEIAPPYRAQAAGQGRVTLRYANYPCGPSDFAHQRVALARLRLPGDAAAIELRVEIAGSCRERSGPMELVATVDGPERVIPWRAAAATVTPVPSPSPRLPSCTAADLTSEFAGVGAATGSLSETFWLDASPGIRCLLPANPALRLLDAAGRAVREIPAPPRIGTVRLGEAQRKDHEGDLVLQWSNHGAEPGYVCRGTAAPVATIEVSLLEGSRVVLRIPADRRPIFCADPPEGIFVLIQAAEPAPPYVEPAFNADIAAPPSAGAGQPLDHLIRLTNRTNRTQSLDPCPAYVENVAGPQELGSSDKPGFCYAEQRYVLNCADVRPIAPGMTVTFAMRFEVPADLLPGGYVLPWRLDGPPGSTGTKASILITSP